MSHKNTVMFVVGMLPAVLLQAQNERQPQPAPVATSNVAGQNDAILAIWLHVGSTNEVSLAQVALKQAQHGDVRAYAQKMIDDHTAWAAKLQPLTNASGTGAGKDRSGERGRPDQGEGTTPNTKPKNPSDASSPRAGTAVGSFDHAGLIRDLGRKCLQSETKMLTSKTGAEFDRCYMRMQVASHVRSADMVEVFRTYASPNLTPTLEAGQKTIAAHLERAKTLSKQVDDEGTANGNGNGNGNGGGGKPPRDGR